MVNLPITIKLNCLFGRHILKEVIMKSRFKLILTTLLCVSTVPLHGMVARMGGRALSALTHVNRVIPTASRSIAQRYASPQSVKPVINFTKQFFTGSSKYVPVARILTSEGYQEYQYNGIPPITGLLLLGWMLPSIKDIVSALEDMFPKPTEPSYESQFEFIDSIYDEYFSLQNPIGSFEELTQKEREEKFNKHENFHQQEILIYQMQQYLLQKWQVSWEECTKEQKRILGNMTGGVCLGFSRLWASAKKTENERPYPYNYYDKKNNKQLLDDIAYFNSMHKKLVLWDRKSIFPSHETDEIDRFIEFIIFFQEQRGKILAAAKDHNDTTFPAVFGKNTQGKTLHHVATHQLFGNEKLLSHYLEQIIKPQQIVEISIQFNDKIKGRHAISCYKNSRGKLFFRDPNARKGESSPSTMEDLVYNLFIETKEISPSPFRLITVRTYELSLDETITSSSSLELTSPSCSDVFTALIAAAQVEESYTKLISTLVKGEYYDYVEYEAIEQTPADFLTATMESKEKKRFILYCIENFYKKDLYTMPNVAHFLLTQEWYPVSKLLAEKVITQDALGVMLYIAKKYKYKQDHAEAHQKAVAN